MEDYIICYHCGLPIVSFDFYWIVIDAEGNQYLADDYGKPLEGDELMEMETCPHCGAHY